MHVEVSNTTDERCVLTAVARGGRTEGEQLRVIPLEPGASFRFMVSKTAPDQDGLAVLCDRGVEVSFFEVFDRAHFPVLNTSQIKHSSDRVPEPALLGMPSRRRPRS